MRYRHAPGTIWRHALRRVDRRARILREAEQAEQADPTTGTLWYVLACRADLREAARLANRLAYCAGIGWPR